MPKVTRTAFAAILEATRAYKREISAALEEFAAAEESAKKEAAQFKDEQRRHSELTARAKQQALLRIHSARNALDGTVRAEAGALRDEMARHLTARPSSVFLETLRTYREFGIKPSRPEVEALLQLNAGNSLGLRALGATLEHVHSTFKVSAPAVETFEGDISAAERMIRPNAQWTPPEHRVAALAVLGDTEITYERPDGTAYTDGRTWDGTRLSIASAGFESDLRRLESAATRWDENLVPDIRLVDTKDETSVREYVDDLQHATDAAQIREQPQFAEQAAAIGRARSAEAEASRAVMEHYTA